MRSHNLKITTPQDLIDQEILSNATLLKLPESILNRGVIFVNSKETLEEAARILGLTLDDYSHPFGDKILLSTLFNNYNENKSSNVISNVNVDIDVGVGVKSDSANQHKNDNDSENESKNDYSTSHTEKVPSISSSSGNNNINSSNNQSATKTNHTKPISASLSRLPLSKIRLYVGVDSEWKAVMLRKGETSSSQCQEGAAIMQVRM